MPFRGKLDPTCTHSFGSAQITSDTIMNCPAEGSPDEEVVALRCGLCKGILARTSEGVLEVLLGHIQQLESEVEDLKRRATS